MRARQGPTSYTILITLTIPLHFKKRRGKKFIIHSNRRHALLCLNIEIIVHLLIAYMAWPLFQNATSKYSMRYFVSLQNTKHKWHSTISLYCLLIREEQISICHYIKIPILANSIIWATEKRFEHGLNFVCNLQLGKFASTKNNFIILKMVLNLINQTGNNEFLWPNVDHIYPFWDILICSKCVIIF